VQKANNELGAIITETPELNNPPFSTQHSKSQANVMSTSLSKFFEITVTLGVPKSIAREHNRNLELAAGE
jgi:hypothetical protein